MSGGTEDRGQILPSVQPEDTGYMQPHYDVGGNVDTPVDIKVTGRGGSVKDVINSMKGVAYYVDVIGFGKTSKPVNDFLGPMPHHPLGLAYFHKTGLICDNGADMWAYFNGIPQGNIFGKKITKKLESLGLPSLQGLAPGILEDAGAALDPRPMAQAVMGGAYPKCVQVTAPVGDTHGNTRDYYNGDEWIQGDVGYYQGVPIQTRWVQAKNAKKNPIYISKEEWDKTPKVFNRDGTPVKTEGFQDSGQKASLLLAVVFLCGALVLRSM